MSNYDIFRKVSNMKLNLDFYNGKDSYSDGKIEDKIIKYIKTNQASDFNDIIVKDKSWPVFYHLSSLRENVINWYPFKENSSILEVGAGMGALTSLLCKKCKSVTSIELSKKRATAILERNKDAKNLEIIVGNLKDIKLDKKFDYILLCGVLEYGALYMDSDNPYIDFINKLKENLNPNGKILIAIENRLGIKYLCGAAEDHLDVPFCGVNNYGEDSKIRTFSKPELERIAKDVKMNINFYYMFPDYKFPQILLTDKSLNKISDFNYMPYYYRKMDLVINEQQLFNDMKDNSTIPNFANSYFIELSEKKTPIEVEYAKFNFYRKPEYNLFTYLKDGKFYKAKSNDKASHQMDAILDIEDRLSSSKIDHVKVKKEKDALYTEASNLKTLDSILDELLKNNDEKKVFDIYDNLYKYLKTISGDIVKSDNTIFEKYGVKVSKAEKNKLHFYKNGYIDIIPSNILVDNDKFVLFDQEWYEENVPIEYMMYRAISYFFDVRVVNSILGKDFFKKYCVNSKCFRTIENKINKKIHSDEYVKVMSKFTQARIIDINDYERCVNHISNLEKESKLTAQHVNNLEGVIIDNNKHISELSSDCETLANNNRQLHESNKKLQSEIEEIINSKGYKLLEKIRKIGKRNKKK